MHVVNWTINGVLTVCIAARGGQIYRATVMP